VSKRFGITGRNRVDEDLRRSRFVQLFGFYVRRREEVMHVIVEDWPTFWKGLIADRNAACSSCIDENGGGPGSVATKAAPEKELGHRDW